MPEVWVTPLACSECLGYHGEDDNDWSDYCDCWCHERDDQSEDDPGDFEWG